MGAISHIMVLSQPEFLQRQVGSVLEGQSASAGQFWRISAWFRKRGALL